MNEFKFQITTFLLVALLAFGGYWAFTSLDRGITYREDEVVVAVEDPEPQDDINEEPVVVEDPNSGDSNVDVVEVEEPQDELSESEQDLLDRLQNLINDDINMREGSRGTRVGTVQEFLNLYLDTQSAVDNQYGPGTRSRVQSFQEAEGLSADGLAGPNTYQAMINVLLGE